MKAHLVATIRNHFEQHEETALATLCELADQIALLPSILSKCIENNGTIFSCGNGGSASDSQHLCAELVGRFLCNREPLRSIALAADAPLITCIGNDFSFDQIFSRQLEALAKPHDILVAISTSGNSVNITKSLHAAKRLDMLTIGLYGNGGGVAKELTDFPLIVPSSVTARIQEMHILLIHILCDLLEKELGYDN